MKRNEGAEAVGGKPENRFAALTSGLLARKGHAAPSNSPIADPAEETDAFATEPTRKTEKKKAAAATAAKEALSKLIQDSKPRAELAAAVRAPEPGARAASKSEAAKTAPLTVINERSLEAGYPDNPSEEEIAALEAEADEVVSYFKNFGNEDAVAAEKDDFYGARTETVEEVEFDDEAPAARTQAAVPPASAGVASVGEPVRAGVSVQLSAREFMRLSMGAAELELSAQELIAEAIEEYLDARAIASLGECACLAALTPKPRR